MKRTLISTACALALCATHATARDTLGITDPTVLQRGFGAEQSFEAGAPDRVWIDAARAERAVRNQWGFVQEALGEADRLISAMEGGRSPELSNPPLRTVRQ